MRVKRKMVYIGVSYAIGLFFASFITQISQVFLLAIVLVSGLLIMKYGAGMNLKEICMCGISFIFGVSLYFSYNVLTYEAVIKYAGTEEPTEFCGKVLDVKEYAGDKSQYRIRGRLDGVQQAEILVYYDSKECDYGDKVTLSGTFEEFENSYIFPSKDYYKSQNIFLEASDIKDFQTEKSNTFSVVKVLRHYRDYISKVFYRVLAEDEADVLNAMMFGAKSGMDSYTKNSLFRMGIGHVMAVSGLHLVLFAEVVRKTLEKFLKNKKVIFMITEIFLVMFCICSGMSMSVMRSFIMLLIVYSADIFERKADTLNSLCIAVIVLTIFKPYTITNSSFLLSVSGVFGTGVVAPYLTGEMKASTKPQRLLRNIVSLLCTTIAVMPVSVMYFDETSLISPVSNLLLVPLCMMAMVTGFIVFFTGGLNIVAIPVLSLGGICCKIVTKVSETAGNFEFTHISFSGEYTEIFTAIFCIIALLACGIFRTRKSLVTVMITAVIFMAGTGTAQRIADRNMLKIAVVGENRKIAIVITDGKKADIIDFGGGSKTPQYVSKYLKKSGINKVATVTLYDRPLSSMATYSEDLKGINTKVLLVPENTFITDSLKIFSDNLQIENFGNTEIAYPDYKFCLNENLEIFSGDNFSMLCSENMKYYNGEDYSIIGDFGKKHSDILNCAKLIITDKKFTAEQCYRENVVVEVKKNGYFEIKDLR